jgi:hypothetical protein
METIFSVAVPFKDSFVYLDIPASTMAMDIAIDIMGDGMLDAACDHNLCLGHRFEDKGKSYLIGFSYGTTKLLNIWETSTINPESADYDEKLIAEDVRYTILKVYNSETKAEIYNVTECI